MAKRGRKSTAKKPKVIVMNPEALDKASERATIMFYELYMEHKAKQLALQQQAEKNQCSY